MHGAGYTARKNGVAELGESIKGFAKINIEENATEVENNILYLLHVTNLSRQLIYSWKVSRFFYFCAPKAF